MGTSRISGCSIHKRTPRQFQSPKLALSFGDSKLSTYICLFLSNGGISAEIILQDAYHHTIFRISKLSDRIYTIFVRGHNQSMTLSLDHQGQLFHTSYMLSFYSSCYLNVIDLNVSFLSTFKNKLSLDMLFTKVILKYSLPFLSLYLVCFSIQIK